MKKETILCIPTHIAREIKYGNVPILDTSKELIPVREEVLSSPAFDRLFLGPRPYLEFDDNYLQIIPYIVLMTSDGRIGIYRRTSKGGEARLHNKWSVGFGGHITLSDIVTDESGWILAKETILNAGEREVREEVTVSDIYSTSVLGFIYDSKDEVGRVHLGIAMLWRTKNNSYLLPNEDHITECKFVHIDQLVTDDLEGWSKIVVNHLVELYGKT